MGSSTFRSTGFSRGISGCHPQSRNVNFHWNDSHWGGAVYSWGNSRHGRLGRDEGGVTVLGGEKRMGGAWEELALMDDVQVKVWNLNTWLGGGFKYFLFSPLVGEDSHFD